MFSRMGSSLTRTLALALGLPGGDEGAPDVAVADQSVAEGDAAAPGIALGRGSRSRAPASPWPPGPVTGRRAGAAPGRPAAAHAPAGGVHRLPVAGCRAGRSRRTRTGRALGLIRLGRRGGDHWARHWRRRNDGSLAGQLVDEVAPRCRGPRVSRRGPIRRRAAQAQGGTRRGCVCPPRGIVDENEGERGLKLGKDLEEVLVEVAPVAAGDARDHGDADGLGDEVAVVADGVVGRSPRAESVGADAVAVVAEGDALCRRRRGSRVASPQVLDPAA